MKKIKTKISFILVLALMISIVSAVPSLAASKTVSKKPKLLKSVKVEYYDNDSKSWKPLKSYEFSYNKKGDPSKVEWAYATNPVKCSTTFSYKYRKNGKRKSAAYKESGTRRGDIFETEYSDYTEKGTRYYDKKGRLTKIRESGKFSDENDRFCEEYIYKGAGVYMVKDDIIYRYFKVMTRRPGILKIIKTYHSYPGKWTTDYTFNKEGLIKTFPGYQSGYKFSYTYDKETGLVKSIKQTSNDKKHKYRFTFTYNSKTISKSRYSTMINNILNSTVWSPYEDGDYRFYWY